MKTILSSRRMILMAVVVASTGALPTAFGQITSAAAGVGLTATLTQTLTVTATPGAITFALVPGTVSAASAPVSVVTTWVVNSTVSSVELDGYFASAAGALTDGGGTPVLIPSSEVLGQVTTGTPTTFSAFTGTGALGPAGAGLVLFTQGINNTNRSATRTDSLDLEIDLTGTPQLPAGVYTGTVTVQAVAV